MQNSLAVERPDADALLAAINTQRKRKRGGKLHLYLGMAPGVGKTYAMLLAGHEAAREGNQVVVGVIETHGREETALLLQGLEIIPRRQLDYKGIKLEEMDLDAILVRKPKIVLADELAHTNVPGSRHPKRWQDVFELLDAGIDVYSTLNVQHLESRKESVEQIAGIAVRETVPDSVLDRAYQIRLIDLSPAELLKRLKEGKVYLGDKAELASKNFFQEEKLTALREIALRLAAEKVDTELQTFAASREAGAPWQTVERLLVAIDHKQHCQDIIRSTRRLAFNLEGPWLAVHVDTGHLLSSKQQAQLASNLELARSLGAEVLTISDTKVAEALIRIARQRNVSQIVVGKSRHHWIKNTLRELVYEQSDINILVQGSHVSHQREWHNWRELFQNKVVISDYARSFWFTMLLLIPAAFFEANWILLLGLLALALSTSLGPLLLAATLASLATLYFGLQGVLFSSVSYFCVSLVGGVLNHRIRVNRNLLKEREERSNLLYEVIKDISSIQNRDDMLKAVESRLGSFLTGHTKIYLKRRDGLLKPHMPDIDLGVAKWVLQNQKPAGWSTETLSGTSSLFLPLTGHVEILGVIAFKPGEHTTLSEVDRNLLLTISRQLAISLEKDLFKERALEAERLQEVNQVHRSILSFLADELRSPLSVIVQAVAIMSDRDESILESRRIDMGLHLLTATEKLGFVIDNLLMLSRLAVGIFPIRRTSCNPRRLIQLAQEHLKRTLKGYNIQIICDDTLPALQIDIALMEQAVSNILLNAAQYTPENGTIQVQISHNESEVQIAITDQGPGIPPEYTSRIFDKFYRYPGSRGQGAGIGLAVTKGLVRVHEGKVTVTNPAQGGACFTITLPLPKP